jgi:hypothetical protein
MPDQPIEWRERRWSDAEWKEFLRLLFGPLKE